MRVLEWTLAGYDRLGVVRPREGNRLGHSAPLDNYPTGGRRLRVHRGRVGRQFRPPVPGHGPPRPVADPRFAALAGRATHGDEINGIVAEWTGD